MPLEDSLVVVVVVVVAFVDAEVVGMGKIDVSDLLEDHPVVVLGGVLVGGGGISVVLVFDVRSV